MSSCEYEVFQPDVIEGCTTASMLMSVVVMNGNLHYGCVTVENIHLDRL